MAVILNIDTSLSSASVAIADNGMVKAVRTNPEQQDHAAWVQPAIEQLLNELATEGSMLDAIGVAEGPGSYTGLRVGMATAKGLCYAWDKPLITVSTLKLMALAAKMEDEGADLFAPMIDARRQEVFTALFDSELQELFPARAMILEDNSFAEWLSSHRILFSGNGMPKWRAVCKHEQALFSAVQHSIQHLALLAEESSQKGLFANLFYAEPAYSKEFHTHHKN
ncbi:MAG TPA: tRNA (adenosine(37)-N6)-threonylcarbamoyltransferase complex dimerization subunit type 1 TsaB [Chitinophagaceae bacterium]|nr:tRNA (adenosine(37)-N6)-threonylcarbamoyltransferase complex dimerization subunit type 1 TsaB [Chitinophagaceae bacterium]